MDSFLKFTIMGRVTHSILSGRSGVSRARPATRSSFTYLRNAHRELSRFAVIFLGGYPSFAGLFFGKHKGLVTIYNQMLISKGNLPEMIPGSMSAGAAQAVRVTWMNNAPPAGSNENYLRPVFVYLPTRRDGPFFSGVATRQAGAATVNLLPFYTGEEGNAACNSKYIGAVKNSKLFS